MSIRESLVQVWLVLSLISVLIDVACFWLVQHTPAPLPGSYTFNYITIFLVSAPAPIVLAILLTMLGGALAMLRWIWVGCRRAMHHSKPGISRYSLDRMGPSAITERTG